MTLKLKKIAAIVFIFWMTVAGISAQQTEAGAAAAIKSGNFKLAREIHRSLALSSAEPASNLIWVARLSAWLGDYSEAIRVYDSLLSRQPQNNEALLGKAYVFMWQKDYRAAKEELRKAERNGRYDTALLITKINFYRYQNLLKEANEALRVAREVSPKNVEVIELERILEKAKTKKYTIGCDQQFEVFTPKTVSCFASLEYQRGADRLTVGTRVGTRFDKSYRSVTASWRRTITPKLTFSGSVELEPDKNHGFDSDFGLNYLLDKKTSIGADARIWRINGKTIRIYSANSGYSVLPGLRVQSTLFFSGKPVLMLRADKSLRKNFSTNLTYSRTLGKSQCEACTTQSAFSAGGRFSISDRFSAFGSVGAVRNANGTWQKTLGFGFTISK